MWIGFLQWLHLHGLEPLDRPILPKLQTIENRDAILDWVTKPGNGGGKIPVPATWPEADFIIGNPPFLGVRQLRKAGLSDDYIAALVATYDLPGTCDLCCYWFELARRRIKASQLTRTGLLATQAIRSTDNREVLRRITEDGAIFLAWSDRPWTLDGAAVRVSIIGFDAGHEAEHLLDGQVVDRINSDLSSNLDVAAARPIPENGCIAFMGDTKGGPFDIEWTEA